MKYNFLPYWYKEKSKNRNEGILSSLVVIMFSVNLCLSIYIYNIKSEHNINTFKNNNIIFKRKAKTKDLSCLKNYDEFLKLQGIKEIYDVTVNTNNIDAFFRINDMNSYEQKAKEIELNKEYSIQKLDTPIEKNDNTKVFEVSIEVNKKRWKRL